MERLNEISKKLTENISYYYTSINGVSVEEIIKMNMTLAEVENKLLQYYLLNKIHGQRGLKSFRMFLNRIIKINEQNVDIQEKINNLEILLKDFSIKI